MIKHDNYNPIQNISHLTYQVLKDRLRLGIDLSDKDKIIAQFEEITKNIDEQAQEEYNSKLDDLFETVTTLEEEKERLAKLIRFINDRIQAREKILVNYKEATGKDLIGLRPINYALEVKSYQERLENIEKYLDNTKRIAETESDIKVITEDLERERETKQQNELKNQRLEDELKNAFLESISGIEVVNEIREIKLISYLESLNLSSDISDELFKLSEKIKKLENDYNVYELSFLTLKRVGALDNEQELIGGLQTIGEELYFHKEQEYMLNLYKLISNKESEYSGIFEKREAMDAIFKERNILRNKLTINSIDVLEPFRILLQNQMVEIVNQRQNVEIIDRLVEKKMMKEEKLSRLKEDNSRVEILSLLREFCLIPMVEEEKTEVPVEKFTINDLAANIPSNQIKDIEPGILDNLIEKKAINVMQVVGDKLGVGPKKEVPEPNKYIPDTSSMTFNLPDVDLPVREETIAPLNNNLEVSTDKPDPLLVLPTENVVKEEVVNNKEGVVNNSAFLDAIKEFKEEITNNENAFPNLDKKEPENNIMPETSFWQSNLNYDIPEAGLDNSMEFPEIGPVTKNEERVSDNPLAPELSPANNEMPTIPTNDLPKENPEPKVEQVVTNSMTPNIPIVKQSNSALDNLSSFSLGGQTIAIPTISQPADTAGGGESLSPNEAYVRVLNRSA